MPKLQTARLELIPAHWHQKVCTKLAKRRFDVESGARTLSIGTHIKENKAMKRILLGTLFTAVSINAMAQAPGGPDCGWGNMLFEGQRGTPAHFLASTTNGTSGNATFGMTSGTNGCSTNAALTYGGKSWFAMNGMMNELSEDMAKGNGEALTTYAVVLGVAPEDRAHFAAVTHEHFQQIFSKADVTAEDVHTNTLAVLKADPRLAKYATQA